jgi:virulence-associated protein VagC
MKTFRKSMLIAMMVMVPALSFANGNKPTVKVKKVGAKTIALYTSQQGAGKTHVKLKDQNGLVLHEIVSKNDKEVTKKLDLTVLPNGDYSIEVENEASFVATPLRLEANQVFIQQTDQVVIIKPVIRQNGDIVDLIMPDEDNAFINIRIYDKHSQRLYRETVEGSATLRRYDFSKLGKGNYSIRMKTKGQEFIQFVALD